jgi:ketosteroid isomerase-like protein
MSQADVDALKEGFDAYNGEDFERLLELWDEDVEIAGLLVGGEPLRGREAARNWLVPEAIDQRGEPVEFRDLGGRVLVSCDWHIHGRGSGVDVDTRLYILFTMQVGKVARLEAFGDEQEAREAAGLSEEACNGAVDTTAIHCRVGRGSLKWQKSAVSNAATQVQLLAPPLSFPCLRRCPGNTA